MQLPTTRTPVARCIELGLYAQSMLSKLPEAPTLATLSDKLGVFVQALGQAQAIYTEAELKLITARAEMRFADHAANRQVRALHHTVEIADGMKKGKLAASILPEGITPVVRLVGATRVAELRTMEGRLEAAGATWAGAAGEKAKLTSARQRYDGAIAARRLAIEDVDDTRARRNAAKEQLLDAYAQVAAQVKATFPRNRQMQDLFFDQVIGRDATETAADGSEDLQLDERALPS